MDLGSIVLMPCVQMPWCFDFGKKSYNHLVEWWAFSTLATLTVALDTLGKENQNQKCENAFQSPSFFLSLILCDCHNSYLQMVQFKMMFGSNILAIFLLSPFIKAYCCVVTFSSLLSLLSMPFNAFCTLCSFGKWQLKQNMKFKNIAQTYKFVFYL